MTYHAIAPFSGAVKPVAAEKTSFLSHTNEPADDTPVDWEVTLAGPKQLPIMQFRYIRPGAPFVNVLMELGWVANDRLTGRLLLPTVLDPSSGVTLSVDGVALGEKARFATFLRTGGVVAIDWKSEEIDRLYQGQKLAIKGRFASNKKPIAFELPLKNFSATAENLKDVIAKRNT